MTQWEFRAGEAFFAAQGWLKGVGKIKVKGVEKITLCTYLKCGALCIMYVFCSHDPTSPRSYPFGNTPLSSVTFVVRNFYALKLAQQSCIAFLPGRLAFCADDSYAPRQTQQKKAKSLVLIGRGR